MKLFSRLKFIPILAMALPLILTSVITLPETVIASRLPVGQIAYEIFPNSNPYPQLLAQAPATDTIQAALENPNRPDADKSRDDRDHTAQVLDFLGVEPGMAVADLMAGGGYYTELFSRIVGNEGQVYMQNEYIGWPWEKFFPSMISARLEHYRLANVTRLDAPLETMGLPEGELDLVFLSLFYHDSVWMGIDRQKVLQEIYTALKPDGIFAIIDNCSEPRVGIRDVSSKHRIDREFVIEDLLAAGFTVDATSDILSNPGDDHTLSAFDPAIRSHTDRFIISFSKS